MTQVAGTLLIIGGKYVALQRRDNKPSIISPGLLSLFGGRIEAGEKPVEAATRELQEETSLDLSTLTLEHVIDFTLDGVENYMFKTDIPNADFKVHEGVGAEVYSMEEAITRDDITELARKTIIAVIKGEE